jgi:hypothetical protein
MFNFLPPGVHKPDAREDPSAAIRIDDTAPEVNASRALGYLRDADWMLVEGITNWGQADSGG